MRKVLFLFLFSICSHVIAIEISWDTPETISNLGTDARNPQVGMDTNDDAVAIFLQNDRIAAVTKTAMGTWTAPDFLSPMGASNPRIVVDNAGNATIAWIQGAGALRTRERPAGGSWSSFTVLDTQVDSLEMDVSNTGDVVIVYERNGDIRSLTKLSGGSFPGTPDTLSTTAGADTPQVSIGNDGTVVAVWHNIVSMIDTIYSSNKTISGGTWTAEEVISTASERSILPSVSVDRLGDAIAAWYTFESQGATRFTNVLVNVAKREFNGSWGAPEVISEPFISDPEDIPTPGNYDPKLLEIKTGFDLERTAIVAWRNARNGMSFSVNTSTLLAGSNTWSEPTDFAMSLYSLDFDLLVPRDRLAFLAFMLGSTSSIDIQAFVSNIDNSIPNFWFDQGVVSMDFMQNSAPSIGANVGPNALTATILWEAYDGSNIVIQAIQGSTDLVRPPENLMVMQNAVNFNVFTELENVITWTASPSMDVESYNIYRNDILITQVDASTFSFTDHNRPAGESVTYSISAVDENFNESDRANVIFP